MINIDKGVACWKLFVLVQAIVKLCHSNSLWPREGTRVSFRKCDADIRFGEELDPVSRVTGIPGIKCSDTTRVGLVY